MHVGAPGWFLQVIPAEFAGKKDIVPLEAQFVDFGETGLGFKYRQQVFLYNSDLGCFDKLKYPTSVCAAFYVSLGPATISARGPWGTRPERGIAGQWLDVSLSYFSTLFVLVWLSMPAVA